MRRSRCRRQTGSPLVIGSAKYRSGVKGIYFRGSSINSRKGKWVCDVVVWRQRKHQSIKAFLDMDLRKGYKVNGKGPGGGSKPKETWPTFAKNGGEATGLQ